MGHHLLFILDDTLHVAVKIYSGGMKKELME
jgi:hypothetical protein